MLAYRKARAATQTSGDVVRTWHIADILVQLRRLSKKSHQIVRETPNSQTYQFPVKHESHMLRIAVVNKFELREML